MPFVPMRNQQNGGNVVTDGSHDWVSINDTFGSYKAFLHNISGSAKFKAAVRSAYDRADNVTEYACSDWRVGNAEELLEMEIEMGAYIVDVRSVPLDFGLQQLVVQMALEDFNPV